MREMIHRNKHWLVYAIPLILAVAMMLPRLLSAQFGFFDDARTLTTAEEIITEGWDLSFEAGSGRFRPMYWLQYVAVYALVGAQPLSFFFLNLSLLLLNVLLIVKLVFELDGNRFQAGLAAALFILTPEVMENVYTLSKPENLQLCFMLLSLFALSRVAKGSAFARQITWVFISALCVFLAALTKETAGVMGVVAIGWLLIHLLFFRKVPDGFRSNRKLHTCLILAVFAGIGIFLAARQIFLPFGLFEQGYSSGFTLSAGFIIDRLRIWLDILRWQVLYVFPVGVVFVLLTLIRKNWQKLVQSLYPLTWMLVFFALYLPWKFTQGYYLLPLAAGIAWLVSMMVVYVWDCMHDRSKWIRIAAFLGIAGSLALWCLSLPNHIANGRLQLTMDKANAEMLAYVLDEIPTDAVVVMNIQQPNEYVHQFPSYFSDIHGRTDLEFDYYHEQDFAAEEYSGSEIFILAPVLENQFYPSVRMGIYEHTSREWMQNLQDTYGAALELVARPFGVFFSKRIDIMRLPCLWIETRSFCNVPNTPFDTRRLGYGWEIYQLNLTE